MKYIINLLKCIFNPLYMIITANEENKTFLKHIKKKDRIFIDFNFFFNNIDYCIYLLL